jgi:hypothetical protein
MATLEDVAAPLTYPVTVTVQPALENRNRLTTAFRFFLAIPHLLLVGGPIAVISSIGWSTDNGSDLGFGSGGLLSAVACLLAVFGWFAIVFTGKQPANLWQLCMWYLSWRLRAVAYMTLLRDEYPPFGDGPYPAELKVERPAGERDRVTVFFRLLLAIPHFLVLWLLSLVWAVTTAIAWIMILLTGRYPETLYGFAIGVLAWGVRVEAYVLLLRDEYPPFTLRA